MPKYQYRGAGVVEANGYRWEGRSKRAKALKEGVNPTEADDTFGSIVDVPDSDVATLQKLKKHPSFRLVV